MPHSDGAGPAQNLHSAAECQVGWAVSFRFFALLFGGRSCIPLVHGPFTVPSLDPLSFFTSKKKRRERENFFLPLQSYTLSTLFSNVYSGFRTAKLGINAGEGVQYNFLSTTTTYHTLRRSI